MKPVKIRNLEIGCGRPKICVPIVERTKEEILSFAEKIIQSKADMVEWRADWYESVMDFDKVREVLTELRKILEDRPILFTFRTLQEGGEQLIGMEAYQELNCNVCRSGMVDLVDVELSAGKDIMNEILKTAHEYHVYGIASSHDFEKTPTKEEIILKLCSMQELGADIAKIAVMPQNKKDVLTLLAATEEVVTKGSEIPLVTISMGSYGSISRISGEIFGSSITFGTVEKASAPGQFDAEKLYEMLESIHQNG